MNPLRRLIFLALLTSVVMAEPTNARALTAAVIADAAEATPTLVPGSWVRRLSTLLRRTVRPAVDAIARRRRRLSDAARALVATPGIASVHATFAAHVFRLPPPFAQLN